MFFGLSERQTAQVQPMTGTPTDVEVPRNVKVARGTAGSYAAMRSRRKRRSRARDEWLAFPADAC